ncbi:MAG: hypothetical protein ACK5ME_04135 [Parahaliea sp.]
MADFQLTHIALVGTRMNTFKSYGYNSRESLTMCRVAPELPEDRAVLRTTLREQLPIWIHNIITDPEFPARTRLNMPLRRFEGELNDNRDNAVISTVLHHGFKGLQFDPLNLPTAMPMRQRCTMVAHQSTWREAFNRLQTEILDILEQNADKLKQWCEFASQPEHSTVGG